LALFSKGGAPALATLISVTLSSNQGRTAFRARNFSPSSDLIEKPAVMPV
jgi:hypothetical protein